MSAQTSYGYSTPIGAPGGIVDLAPHAIDTFLNDEENGVMKFGVGVVDGATPGKTVKLPTGESKSTDFAGITTNNRHTEYDLDGKIRITKGRPVGVMRYGRVYGRVAAGETVAYGDAVYLVASGDDAGCFTNSDSGNIAIKARFLGGVDAATLVAPIELFNQAQESGD